MDSTTGRTDRYATRSFFADSHLEPNAVRVCRGLSCDLHGSAAIRSRLRADAVVADVYCLGYCHDSPALLDSKGNVHCDDDAGQFVATSVLPGTVPTKSPSITAANCEAVVTGRIQNGAVHEISRAIEVGVYSALAVALHQGSSTTLECIVASGEQGRGGAGFPTGVKWRHCADASGQEKFVVANGDEGDPGSFADRLLMERDPHSIIEGMAICAFAVGACRGFVYIRSEYPLALQRFAEAVRSAREAGFLGTNIRGSGFTFDIEVVSGQGSYVCGEETALLNAIEGRRGEVRIRPPYPIERGLFDRPTVVNNVTNYSHDSMGRLTLIDPPGTWDNTSVTYNFSSGGVVQTKTKGQSRVTTTHDGMFRPVLLRSQALDTGWSSYVNTEYDELNRVAFRSQPSTSATTTAGTNYAYDALGRIKTATETVAPFAETEHVYLPSHRHRIYDPSNAFVDYYSYGYDGPGNTDYRAIYSYADGVYQQKTYIYQNVHGQITRLRQWGDTNGFNVDQSQYFYYDSLQRLCRHYVPETGATKYQYNVAGELTAYSKGQGNSGCGTVPNGAAKVSLTYDLLGRPKNTDFFDSSTPDISRTYDANGNLKTVSRGGINWSYNYNDIDLTTQESLDIDGRSYDLTYTYSTSAHLASKNLPSGVVINYSPDGMGRFKTLTWNAQTLASGISYHPSGEIAAITYGNGQTFSQTLNSRLFPLRLRSFKGSQTAIDQTYGYDARGKIISITDGAVSGNNRDYEYDGLGRLVSATGPWGAGTYVYDALDNLRQKSLGSRSVLLGYDSNNRLTQSTDSGPSGSRTIGYDSRGNVTTLGGLNFAYDWSDQPVSITGTSTGSYSYDGNMKRAKAVVNGKTIYNVYDLAGTLVHVDAVTDNKVTDYVSGPNGAFARISNSAITYLHSDHIGSAQSGTNISGSVVWRERYTPFGEELVGSSANTDLAGFTGHIRDGSTGLNYMQARYYDPVVGRFLSNDPVTFMQTGKPGMFNRYAYVHNDPVNSIDPTGMCSGRGLAGIMGCDNVGSAPSLDSNPAAEGSGSSSSGVGLDTISNFSSGDANGGRIQVAMGDTLRTKVNVLIAQGKINEAFYYAQRIGTPAATALATKIQGFQAAIQQIITKNPCNSGNCAHVAQSIANAFTSMSPRAQPIIYRLNPTPGRTPFIYISDKVAAPQHFVVRVGNTVFDSFTGGQGMAYSTYIRTMNSLNGGANAYTIKTVEKISEWL